MQKRPHTSLAAGEMLAHLLSSLSRQHFQKSISVSIIGSFFSLLHNLETGFCLLNPRLYVKPACRWGRPARNCGCPASLVSFWSVSGRSRWKWFSRDQFQRQLSTESWSHERHFMEALVARALFREGTCTCIFAGTARPS